MPEISGSSSIDTSEIPASELYNDPRVQELMQSSQELQEDLESEVTIPHTVEGITVMSPGQWNGLDYKADEIRKAFENTDWNDGKNRALYWDHEDQESEKWIGRLQNPRLEGDRIIGDLELVDKEAAMKLAWGAKFGVSPKVTGDRARGAIKDFTFDNFSVVLEPAVKTAWINSAMPLQSKEDDQVVELSEEDIEDNEVEMSREDVIDAVMTLLSRELDKDREEIMSMLREGDTMPNKEQEAEASEQDELEDEEKAQEDVADAQDAEEGQPEAQEGDAESQESEENEDQGLDLDKLAEKVMEKIDNKKHKGPEDKEYPEPERKMGEEEASEQDLEDVESFEEFAREALKENPNKDLTELAEEFEQDQKDPEEILEEKTSKLEEKIDALAEKVDSKDEKIDELESQLEEPQKLSQKEGKAQEAEELSEKVSDWDDEKVNKGMMANLIRRQGNRRMLEEVK